MLSDAFWDSHAPILIVVGSAALDYALGDPWHWIHPVQVMGAVIHRYSLWVLKHYNHPRTLRLAGILLTLGMIGGTGLISWGLLWVATSLNPWLGRGCAVILLASCLAGRSLRAAAEDVLSPLAEGDLATARQKLAQYVGRDTEDLSEADMLRAVIETVSENATDGVMAPLFYALVGLGLPWIGSVPLAMAYKAASTLDSMVGYRTAPYTDLGWFSARCEDGLTWLPCRLTVLTIASLSGQPLRVLRLCRRDAIADPSPNAGWSECAYAATLGVQMGGLNRYQGQIKAKPLLGDPHQPITPERIHAALRLTRHSILLWITLGLIYGFLVTNLRTAIGS